MGTTVKSLGNPIQELLSSRHFVYPHMLMPLGLGIIGNIIRIPNKMVPSEGFFKFCQYSIAELQFFTIFHWYRTNFEKKPH